MIAINDPFQLHGTPKKTYMPGGFEVFGDLSVSMEDKKEIKNIYKVKTMAEAIEYIKKLYKL